MIDNSEILSIVRAEAQNSIGVSDTDSELSKDRSKAIDYYNGKMDDVPHLPGWSSVKSRDVYQTVESALPDIIEIFTSDENIMEFTPSGEDDVEKAQQETQVVNHVFYQQNNGFLVLYTFIKEALLTKNGFTKVFWDERETDEVEEYFNIDEDQLTALRADDDLEVTEVTTNKEGTGEFLPAIEVGEDGIEITQGEEIIKITHDVVAKRTKDASQVRVQAIPGEEVSISNNAYEIQNATLVRHEPKDTKRSSLLEMGIDKKLVNQLRAVDQDDDEEELARDTLNKDEFQTTSQNKSRESVQVADNYIRIDINENGKSELWHIMTGNDDTIVLHKQRISRVPISTMSPILQTFQMYGLSLADAVLDIQRIKTFFTRAAIDNAASLNNQRPVISQANITDSTIDDVLTNRPGAPIIVKGDVRQAFTYAENNNIAPDMIGLIKYFDSVMVERTGITRFGQDMDPDAIRKDISATEFAGQRADALKAIKLIARIFAETGLKDLWLNIHYTLQTNSAGKELSLRINGKFVNVNPREWHTRTDMIINVGLGTGSKAEQIGQLSSILEQQKLAFTEQGNQDGPLVSLAQIRHTLARIIGLMGLNNADAFFKQIDEEFKQPEQDEPQDPAILKIQSDAANNAEKNQIEREKNQMNALIEKDDNDQDRQVKIFQITQELELKARGMGLEFDFKTALAQAELTLKEQQQDFNQQLAAINTGVGFAKDADQIENEPISTNIVSDVRIGGEIAG